MDKELPVSVWPEWRITEKIGEGSFGKVYKAQRTEKGRSFYSAIKIISIPSSKSELNGVRSETGDEQAVRDYFQNLVEECIQEISTMEYFRGNSHIVSVEDFKVMEYLDEVGWEISIRMEYLTSFMDYCVGKNLTEQEVIQLGIDLSKALEYCEKLNIMHRDIKPENIFVSRFGDFKLGDFGIARELELSMSSLSKKGTYSYMAPEMYRGEQYDSRVDIYSLGLVLYKLMNHNRLPFMNLEKQLITYRDKENALARRMSGEMPPRPADAGRDFARIILKACAYDPENRYQKPEELHRALENLKYGKETVNKTQTEEHGPSESGNTSDYKKETDSEKTPGDGIGNEKKLYSSTSETEQAENISRRERRYRRHSQTPAPWTVAAVLVGLAACIITGLVLKVVLDADRRAQNPQEIVQVLEKNEHSTAQIDDFSTAIQSIKDHATTIVNELDTYKREGKEGEILHYYNKDGQLMKTLIYPDFSQDGLYEEYYYWNEELFFAYIWESDNKFELYYYENGSLIRWIDRDGTVHDSELGNEDYMARSEKYWKTARKQLGE